MLTKFIVNFNKINCFSLESQLIQIRFYSNRVGNYYRNYSTLGFIAFPRFLEIIQNAEKLTPQIQLEV